MQSENLEVFEVRFKNREGKWVTKHVQNISDHWGPTLTVAQDNHNITSLDEIQNLEYVAPYIKEFTLGYNRLKHIDLSRFSRLRKIHLDANKIKKIIGLDKIYDLEEIYLNFNSLKSIENLSHLKKLRKLVLKNNKISKIEGIKDLKNLKELDLSNNQISKIEGLVGLANLEKLNLSNNQISKIEGLDGLKNLKDLNLRNNNISKIKNIDSLVNLRRLFLKNNPVLRISGLSHSGKLKSLDLGGTKIKSLEGIEDAHNLTYLFISDSNVSSLEPLKNLKKISTLIIRENPVRSLYGFTPDMSHSYGLGIDPENLCPTGARLYKEATERKELGLFHGDDIRHVLEFYNRSVTDLALQHANQSDKSNQLLPLTATEIERLIHEASQKERMILEDAIDKNLLPPDDSILSQITAKFSIKVKISKGKNKNLKIFF